MNPRIFAAISIAAAIAPGTPEEFGAFLKSESARYAKVVREAGAKVD